MRTSDRPHVARASGPGLPWADDPDDLPPLPGGEDPDDVPTLPPGEDPDELPAPA